MFKNFVGQMRTKMSIGLRGWNDKPNLIRDWNVGIGKKTETIFLAGNIGFWQYPMNLVGMQKSMVSASEVSCSLSKNRVWNCLKL